MSTLVITIDATPDVVMSATKDATDIGISDYTEPAILTSVNYSPGSPYLHGSTALSSRREQTMLAFRVSPFGAANETEAKTLIAALRAAVEQFSYTVTVAANEVSTIWQCDAGSVTPAGSRTRINLDRPHITEWNVTIPCYPVPS